MYLLDSDVFVDILRGHPPALEWLASIASEEILVSAFVAMELMQGCRNKTELSQLNSFLEPFRFDWPEEEVFRRALSAFGQAHLSHRVGMIDMLIAQTAIVRELPLCTFNVGHYSAIQELSTIQPYRK